MKHSIVRWFVALLIMVGVALGQDPIKTWSVGMPPSANIIGITYGNATQTSTTYWYWVVSIYTAGSVLNQNSATVTGVTSGDPSGGNPIVVSFNPISGPSSFAVLRTSTSSVPPIPCNLCLVGTTTAATAQVSDTGATLGTFSSTQIIPATGDIRLNNTGYATPTFEYTINGVTTALAPVSSIEALNFYKDDTTIIATGTNNAIQVNTDRTTPNVITEVIDSLSAASNTVGGEAYLYASSLGVNTLPAGTWTANIYAYVSSVSGGRVSTITDNIYVVSPYVTNITTSGSGTSRTATAATGAPFCSGCIQASANIRNASYLQTPQGLYQITGRTSDTIITIATLSTYANEAPAASYGVWSKLFGADTPTITSVSPTLALYSVQVAQPLYHVSPVNQLGEIMFATSNNTTTVSYSHNGTAHYTNLMTTIQ